MKTTPQLLAEIDQDRAQLRDLTDMVRAHRSAGCDAPEWCSGAEPLNALASMHRVQIEHLLLLALVDRAGTPDPHAWP